MKTSEELAKDAFEPLHKFWQECACNWCENTQKALKLIRERDAEWLNKLKEITMVESKSNGKKYYRCDNGGQGCVVIEAIEEESP